MGAPIDVVTQEEIVGLGREASVFKQTQQIGIPITKNASHSQYTADYAESCHPGYIFMSCICFLRPHPLVPDRLQSRHCAVRAVASTISDPRTLSMCVYDHFTTGATTAPTYHFPTTFFHWCCNTSCLPPTESLRTPSLPAESKHPRAGQGADICGKLTVRAHLRQS